MLDAYESLIRQEIPILSWPYRRRSLRQYAHAQRRAHFQFFDHWGERIYIVFQNSNVAILIRFENDVLTILQRIRVFVANA